MTRYVRPWRQLLTTQAFVPLVFSPGEAFQFDWSHEDILLGGLSARVKVAHVRLYYSRICFVAAYPRETQEMVFDARMRAFEFFGGVTLSLTALMEPPWVTFPGFGRIEKLGVFLRTGNAVFGVTSPNGILRTLRIPQG